MKLLVSGSTKSLRSAVQRAPDAFGILTSPAAGNAIPSIVKSGLPWAIDNGAFSGFDEMAFQLLLVRAAYAQRKPEWVVCPYVVLGAVATLDLFSQWQWKIAQHGLPVAFVAQDGQERLPLPPYPLWTCLFIGGSTEFKLSRAAADLASEAKKRHKLVHMGRVNSRRRLAHALDVGCDSVDGSGMSRWGDVHLLKFARWLGVLKQQPVLDWGQG